MNWLKREINGKQLYSFVIASIALNFGYSILAFKVMGILNIGISPVRSAADQIPIFTIFTPFILLGAAFVEEIFFRFAPLFVAVEMELSAKKLFVVVLVISAVFGICHGSAQHILFQGIGGVIFSVVFLKCGAMQGRYFKALIASAVSHFLFNVAVIITAVIKGGATSF